MRRLAVVLVFGALAALGLGAAAARPPYASDTPLTEPRIFGSGVISTGDHESHPAFAPDGQTLYFLKNTPTFDFWTIVTSRFENGAWTTPEVAPFSGRYRDADPFITPDGLRFYFISDRPTGATAGPPKTDLDIWVMDATPAGWGPPRRLDAPVSSAGNEWYPTVAANGTIYFGSDRPGGKGRTDLYRCRLVDGKYADAENLGDAINTEADEFEPWIAPDESYLIFMGARRKDATLGSDDLYLSYNRGGGWTPARNLGAPINSEANELSPKVSPDGRYFFFTSTRGWGSASLDRRLTYAELVAKLRGPGNGLGDIYQVDLAALKLETTAAR